MAPFNVMKFGLSNVDADQLTEARTIAPVVAVQNGFHVARREDAAMLEACVANDISFVPFGPMCGGHVKLDDASLATVAARRGATFQQIALAWLLASSSVTLAIPGTGSLAHLEENIAAGSITLSPGDIAEIGKSGPGGQSEKSSHQ